MDLKIPWYCIIIKSEIAARGRENVFPTPQGIIFHHFRTSGFYFLININASCRFGQAAMWLITTRKQITTPAWWVCVLYKYSKYNSRVESIRAVCVCLKARNAFKRFWQRNAQSTREFVKRAKRSPGFYLFHFRRYFSVGGYGDISFSCLFSTHQGMRWFVCFKIG